MRSSLLALFVVLSFLFTGLAYGADEPLGVFEEREITGLDWERTMVTYRIRGQKSQGGGQKTEAGGQRAEVRGVVRLREPARPGAVELTDEDGNAVPFQLWEVRTSDDGNIEAARISFYASLEAGGSYRYELVSGAPSGIGNGGELRAERSEEGLTLRNAQVAIQLPPAGRFQFDSPLRMADVRRHAELSGNHSKLKDRGVAFGPIRGIRLSDGSWIGGSYFATEPIEAVRAEQNYFDGPVTEKHRQDALAAAPKATGYTCEVTEKGPLFVEARVRFRFDNGGYYELSARVLAGDPAVRIDEVMDLKSTCPAKDPLYVMMSVGDPNWRPDAVFAYGPRGRSYGELEETLTKQGFEPSRGSLPIAYEKDQKVVDLVPHDPWSHRAHYFGVVKTEELARDKKARFLGIVPQHAGSWRGAHWVFPPKNPHLFQRLMAYGNGNLAMRWTIRNQPHPQNLLHTGEFDPEFGLTGMRRLWCLVGGPFQYHDYLHHLRAYEGYVNLNQYKNWIIRWDDQTRSGVQNADVGGVRGRGPAWHVNYAFGGGDTGVGWFSHYRQAQFMGWANKVANKLEAPGLSPEKRGMLRAQVAAFCHMMAEPDFNTRGSATHQGNPNMPINRFFALPFGARLIPDHPRANRWLDVTADYLAFKAGMNTAPGGAWSELVTYYPASQPTLVNGALVGRRHDRLDEETARLVVSPVRFIATLLTPEDPRFGLRGIPGFGHGGYRVGNYWTPAAELTRTFDKELARLFAWAWDRQGRPARANHGDGFAEHTLDQEDLVEQAKPDVLREQLSSTLYPGFGAVLRDRFGTEDEVYFGFRQGYLASHSDANQGDCVLYAHGVPMTTVSVKGYAIHQKKAYKKLYNQFGWFSRVRFGEMSNAGPWPGGGAVSGVHRHFFGPSTDYLRALGDYGPQRWTRQVMFMKSQESGKAGYFLFRDSFRPLDGNPSTLQKKWWYQRTLGTKDQVEPTENGFVYTSEWGPKMEVRTLQPGKVAVQSRDAGITMKLHSRALARGWKETHPGEQFTESITVNALGPVEAGRDILVTMTPLKGGQAAPKAVRLADGAVRVDAGSGADYVFCAPERFRYESDDIVFSGRAGAIRVREDAVRFVMAEGGGTLRYRDYTLTAGRAVSKKVPFEQIKQGGSATLAAREVSISFVLDPDDGPIETIEGGYRRQKEGSVTRYFFDFPKPRTVEEDGVTFEGRRGGIVVDEQANTVRVVMVKGRRIGYGDDMVGFGSGPYDLTFHEDKVVGVTEGPARRLRMTMPAGLQQLPAINIDGVRYAPGTHGDAAIVPVEEGRFEFTLENLPQPPVFRNWVRW